MQLSGLRRWIFTILFMGLSWGVQAQGNHFIYLQTENSKPFYVKIDGKIVSSSSAGYVILPKLESKDYHILIGFPKNEFPEQGFDISLDGSDVGFLLKYFDGKGWSLFNMQSLALIQGSHSLTPQPKKEETKDVFTSLLAEVVKDSSLLTENTTPEEKNTEVAQLPDTTATVQKDLVIQKEIPVWKDSATHSQTPDRDKIIASVLPEGKQVYPPEKEQVNDANNIVRLMSMYDVGGMEFTYLDKKEQDTIRLFMPFGADDQNQDTVAQDEIVYHQQTPPKDSLTITPTVLAPQDVNEQSLKEATTDTVRTVTDNPAPQQDSLILYPQESVKQKKEKKTDKKEEKKTDKIVVMSSSEPDTSAAVNVHCQHIATQEDFLALRKQMAAEETQDGMLEVARKNIKGICFTTEQIKNLSALFLTDKGKYQFFDLAYAHTSDPEQYETLKTEMKDYYYINRFNAMLKK